MLILCPLLYFLLFRSAIIRIRFFQGGENWLVSRLLFFVPEVIDIICGLTFDL